MYMCLKMVNHDDGVDYDATSMLIMDQMIMTTIPDAFFYLNFYSSMVLLIGQATGESMTIHEAMMVVMVIRDEDDDHPR